MRSVLAAALLVAASACTSSSVTGKVHVGPGEEGLAVIAVIWQNMVVPADDADPNSPLEIQPIALGQVAIGTSTAAGGDFDYAFRSLEKGTYFVGAYLDKGDDRAWKPNVDTFSFDLYGAKSAIEVDPDDDAKRDGLRDVWLGMSAPHLVTVRGTLHLSEKAASGRVHILALDGPLGPNPLAEAQPIPAGLDVPYVIHNVPEGRVHVLALASAGPDAEGADPRWAEADDLYAIPPRGGLDVSIEGSREVTDVDLWVDRQAPQLGSISGRITLNAPLATGHVKLQVFTEDPTGDSEPIAYVNVPAKGAIDVPFTVPSMPLGRLYLVGSIHSYEFERDDRTPKTLSAYRLYRKGRDATPIDVTLDGAGSSDVVFPLGVGRISGKIELSNAPANLDESWVVASLPVLNPAPGSANVEIRDADVFVTKPDASGAVSVRYELFGLEDGTYDMTAVPDTSRDGSFLDEYESAGSPGLPPKATIAGGGRTVVDFKANLGP